MKLLAVFKPQTVNATIPQPKLNTGFGTPIIRELIGSDPYEGPYTVTPKVTEQTFPTFAKTMTGDMTVLEISYVAVSNLSGGTTVTIGEI